MNRAGEFDDEHRGGREKEQAAALGMANRQEHSGDAQVERKSPELHDRVAREPGSPPDARSRLGDTQRRIAALARHQPDDVPPSTPQSALAADELSALAQELTVAQEQLRRQTTELELARQLLEAERDRFRELFEVAPEGHIITDSSGTIREANRGAAALLNLPADYVIGKPLAVFIGPDDRRDFRVRAYRARAKLAEEGWTVTLLPRDSAPLRAFIAVSPLLDSTGTSNALRWLVRDISNQRAGVVLDRRPAAVLRSALDALSTHVAVIEVDGAIVTTNRAWRDAPRPGGLFNRAGTGANYLGLCDAALRSGHTSAEIVRGTVARVLEGRDGMGEALYCATPNDSSVDRDNEV